jgi:hypothetical protein
MPKKSCKALVSEKAEVLSLIRQDKKKSSGELAKIYNNSESSVKLYRMKKEIMLILLL